MKRKITRRRFLSTTGFAAATLSLANTFPSASAESDDNREAPLLLWYDKPASEWTEALPIGNGRLGAMIFGVPASEQLQLNEDTLYAGSPYDPNNPEALKALPLARRLIFEGKYQEAHDLVGAKMMAQPIKQMPYEPVGDLRLIFAGHDSVTNYRRQLDLNTAITSVSYKVPATTFTRKIFASPVDQVMVVSLTADGPRQLNFSAMFETPRPLSRQGRYPPTQTRRHHPAGFKPSPLKGTKKHTQ
jgi:alpha-L-fucosidase 2